MRNSKTKGFTLVELIVVIAIIAILAAILVPNMLGYIKNSRWTQADANAKNVHTAATAALAQAYADGKLGSGSAATGPHNVTGKDISLNLTVTVKSVVLDLKTGLGNDFTGKGGFWTDSTASAVTNAYWCSKNVSAPGTIATARNKETEDIIGWYPVPSDASAAAAAST